MTEEDEAFNEIERRSKAKKDAVESSVNAKEALTKLLTDSYDQGVKDALESATQAIKAGKQAIAELESQEPVAWVHNFIEGGISIGRRPSDLDRHPDRWTALYKDPNPCPTCEALARTVMLDQTSHDTHPPQRTWVGLTNEESEHIAGMPVDAFTRVLMTEAKLKEKNT
jgi:hypothetical protein